ncbi:hypothetical protein RJ641_024887 [Dillenia turbinata]|uniref:RING-type E3 ubiquitin transferase n=1 Tax=Dillenia turbinata TaxID=194707 RepID=A0AAN8ZSC7_9MAGN
MGNIGSSRTNSNHSGSGHHSRRHSRRYPPPPPPQPPQPEISANRYVFAAATPYPSQYPNPNANPNPNHPHYYPYPNYYPPGPPSMPVPPLPAPLDHHHHHQPNWENGRYPYPMMQPPPAPYVEHQKAVTIRNDVNLKKETLRIEPDEENPGKFVVVFTFDATVAGSITIMFFAKEGKDCNLSPTKESLFKPVTVHFQQGLGQKFRQPSGTGIDLSLFSEAELTKEGEMDMFPLAVKAEACQVEENESNGGSVPGSSNSQITKAVFEKEKGEFQVRVIKQILWVDGSRYELQEIYGIGNSVDSDFDGNDPGKECVICLSEPRDTTVLPCRHMCMCSGCAKVLRFQTNRCPICRQPVERLLEIKVNNGPED